MRPGPIGPGNATWRAANAMSGARFNAARPNWAGKWRSGRWAHRRITVLQCGPAQLGREMSALAERASSDEAELQCGPAQLGREIFGRIDQILQARAASMRPGPIGPGNQGLAYYYADIDTSFNAARPNWAGKSMTTMQIGPACIKLQCGPAQLGREMGAEPAEGLGRLPASMRPGPIGPGNRSVRAPAELPDGRFNAARPNWAGKLRHRARSLPSSRASMRPGPIGPGNVLWRRPAPVFHVASMRPGPIGPGNRVGAAGCAAPPPRFNAARPNWAGKSATDAATASQLAWLQCGPAQLGREICGLPSADSGAG